MNTNMFYKVVLVVSLGLLGLTVFGPWENYRTFEMGKDGFPVTYVTSYPVWLGRILGYINDTVSEKEVMRKAREEDKKWLNIKIESRGRRD